MSTTTYPTRDELSAMSVRELGAYAATIGVTINPKRAKSDAVMRICQRIDEIAAESTGQWEIGGTPDHARPTQAEVEAMYVERDGVSPHDPPALAQDDAPAPALTDMSPGEVARILVNGSDALVAAAKEIARAMSVGQRAEVRETIMANMPDGEDRLRLLFEAGVQPTKQEADEAKVTNAAKRAAQGDGKRAPKGRAPFNTTERYIVNTLAFYREAMTRKEIDQACKLRSGSIAGHAVKKAYAALVERGILSRSGEGETERFRITDAGSATYAATIGGTPVELLTVPRWVPPAKRESMAAD